MIRDVVSLRAFDRLVSGYLKDGYSVAIFHKDTYGLFLKLTHGNGKQIIAKYDYSSKSYTVK